MIDYIFLSRISIGVIYLFYWVEVALNPFIYKSLLEKWGLEILFWPLWIALIAISVCLIRGKFIKTASIGLFLFLTMIHSFDITTTDLYWPYIGWLLIAFLFIEVGIKKERLIELSWLVAGVTYTMHGIAKIHFAGEDWLNGSIIRGFLFWAQPEFSKLLLSFMVLKPLSIFMGWIVIFFHLMALPHVIFKKYRKFFLITAFVFHSLILMSPLYFVSIGMLPFLLFLKAGTTPPA